MIYIQIVTVFTANVPLLYRVQLLIFNASQHSSNKSVNSIEKLESEMPGSKIDQLPVQTVRPKVEAELTSYYQSRKGHICNLTKDTSRLSVTIDKTEPVSSIKKIEEKIEYTLFNINQLTEQICLLLIDNESEK